MLEVPADEEQPTTSVLAAAAVPMVSGTSLVSSVRWRELPLSPAAAKYTAPAPKLKGGSCVVCCVLVCLCAKPSCSSPYGCTNGQRPVGSGPRSFGGAWDKPIWRPPRATPPFIFMFLVWCWLGGIGGGAAERPAPPPFSPLLAITFGFGPV